MCGAAVLPWVVGLAGIASAASSWISPSASSPTIQAYNPQVSTPTATPAPDAPAASPVMVSQGATGAEDQQGSQEDQQRRARAGRNRLRIDRVTDEQQAGGLGGGSGIVVPD